MSERGEAHPYVATWIPHHHVCAGPRPGGHFLQEEAWSANDWVLEHVSRQVPRRSRA